MSDNVKREIRESDWKVLRRAHPRALERFSERVLGEVETLIHNSDHTHHERYLELFKLIQRRDREMADLFDNPRRSSALTMLAHIRSAGLLGDGEFSSLSEQTRNAIELLLGSR